MKLTLEQIKRMVREELEGLDDEDTIADMAEQVLSASYTGDREAVRRAAQNNAKIVFNTSVELGKRELPKKYTVEFFRDALDSYLNSELPPPSNGLGSLAYLQEMAQQVIDEYTQKPVDEIPDDPDLDMDF